MTSQPQQVETSFYIVVTPEWSRHLKDALKRPILTGIKAERITKGRPDMIRGGGVATKIGLVIDAAAFVPLQPEAVIHVGAHEVEVIHEVTATNPGDAPSEVDA